MVELSNGRLIQLSHVCWQGWLPVHCAAAQDRAAVLREMHRAGPDNLAGRCRARACTKKWYL